MQYSLTTDEAFLIPFISCCVMSFPHQLQGQYDDIAQEADLYKSQLNSERTSSKNLESLLQTNREKEFQSQLQSQEYGAEIQMLKDRLSLNDSKL